MGNGFPFDHFLTNNEADAQEKINIFNHLNKANLPPISSHSSAPKSGENSILNNEIHEKLKKKLSLDTYELYFKESFNFNGLTNGTIQFSIATSTLANIIKDNFSNEINDLILSIFGKAMPFSFEINNLDIPLEKPKTVQESRFTLDLNPTKEDLKFKVESQYLDHVKSTNDYSTIDSEKTFENFIVGPSNQLAFATAQAVSIAPGKSGKYPCLYLYSDSGLGKTHLLHAVANGIKRKFPHMIICMISARNFIKEMIHHITNNNLQDFQKKYTESIDVLMIDDIHELKDKQGTQNEFFHIFNALYEKGKQLIFTSDKAPHEIHGIEERIRTRLQWGLVVDIQKPDIETRMAIVKRKAVEMDLFLSDDILTIIASNIKSSIRELEGALIKLSAAASISNYEIEPETVRQLLNLDRYKTEKKLDIEIIAKEVSKYYSVSLADIKSKSRGKNFVKPRHVCMYLSQKKLGLTLKEIASYFGGRDHTTVLHGINKIEEQINLDPVIRREIEEISALF
ncbi:MAG: chromosomal replication initiator protein DnaA [Bacteriovoracaceae bacterium]